MATIGQKLAEAREDLGLSVDDAAHETRIHPNMILNIEEDDFSMFPSVSYARSFIRNYSEFLDVDLSHAMDALDSSVTGRLSENELMTDMKKTIKKERRFRLDRGPKVAKRRVEKAGGTPMFLNLLLLLLIGALGLFYFLGYNANTPEEARAEMAKGLERVNFFSEDSDDEKIPVKPVGLATSAAEEMPVANVLSTEVSISEPAPVEEATGSVKPVSNVPNVAEIKKPDVKIDLEERPDPGQAIAASRDSVSASRLRPHQSAAVNFSSGLKNVPPLIRSEDLPAALRPKAEPEAMLRPRGTTPVTTPSGNAEVARSQSAENGAPRLRALPVAAFE